MNKIKFYICCYRNYRRKNITNVSALSTKVKTHKKTRVPTLGAKKKTHFQSKLFFEQTNHMNTIDIGFSKFDRDTNMAEYDRSVVYAQSTYRTHHRCSLFL